MGWTEDFVNSPQREIGPTRYKYKPGAHTKLVLDCIHALEKLPGWRRIRKRPVGRFILADNDEHDRPVPRKINGRYATIQVGKTGESDIELLWKPPQMTRPILIVIECKTGTGALSRDQKDYFAETIRGGGFAIEARDIRQMLDQVIKIGAIEALNAGHNPS